MEMRELDSGNQGKSFQCWRPKNTAPFVSCVRMAFTFILPLPSCETLANQSSSCVVPSAAQQAAPHKQPLRHAAVNAHPGSQSPGDIYTEPIATLTLGWFPTAGPLPPCPILCHNHGAHSVWFASQKPNAQHGQSVVERKTYMKSLRVCLGHGSPG